LDSQPSIPPSTNSQSSVIWGAAAATAIGAATAYALEQRRKRKEEEARQRAEAQAATRRNAAQALRLAQNWLTGGQIKKAQKAPAPGPHPPLEAAEAAWLKKKSAADKKPIPSPKPPFTPAQWKGQAYPSYRQGERAGYTASAPQVSKPWRQRAARLTKPTGAGFKP
jgi:hypothetical protein